MYVPHLQSQLSPVIFFHKLGPQTYPMQRRLPRRTSTWQAVDGVLVEGTPGKPKLIPGLSYFPLNSRIWGNTRNGQIFCSNPYEQKISLFGFPGIYIYI